MVRQAVVERVDAQRQRDLVDCHLEREVAQRRAEAAERAAGRAVRVRRRALEARVGRRVQVDGALADAPRHAHARRHVGARVHRRQHLDRLRRARGVDADTDVDVGLLAVAAGDELLGAAVFDTHRPPDPARGQRCQRPQAPLVLVAEAAAHRRADDAYVGLRHVQHLGQRAAVDGMHGAAGLPHRDVIAVPLGQRRARLHAHRAVHLRVEAPLEAPRRRREPLCDVAALDDEAGAADQVAERVLVQHRRAVGQGVRGVVDGLPDEVLDAYEAQRVLGGALAVRDYNSDLIADVAHDGVEHEQVGVDAHRRHVVVREHRVYAGQRQRLRGVDALDAGVGVRAAQDAAVEHAGALEVGGVVSVAAHLGSEAASWRVGADADAESSPSARSRRASQLQFCLPARVTRFTCAPGRLHGCRDAVVSVAAADVAHELPAQRRLRRRLVVLQRRVGRDGEPRHAEAALAPVHLDKRLEQRRKLGPFRQPLDRRNRLRRTCIASSWQASMGLSSTSTVQAPHSPRSQARLAPVRSRASRRTSSSESRCSISMWCVWPLTLS